MTTSDIEPKPPAIEEVWHRLKRAADRSDDPLRLMAVSTIDERDRPASRLMVLRGASSSMKRLWFYTTEGSLKINQLTRRPHICTVGYDSTEILQLVTHGRAELLAEGELADDHWEQFQACAQNIADQPADQSNPHYQADPWMAAMVRSLAAREDAMLREDFVLIDMHVESIELTQINGPTISRFVYEITPE
jgi:general stress protein 26